MKELLGGNSGRMNNLVDFAPAIAYRLVLLCNPVELEQRIELQLLDFALTENKPADMVMGLVDTLLVELLDLLIEIELRNMLLIELELPDLLIEQQFELADMFVGLADLLVELAEIRFVGEIQTHRTMVALGFPFCQKYC
jgi:hypothetical protein